MTRRAETFRLPPPGPLGASAAAISAEVGTRVKVTPITASCGA